MKVEIVKRFEGAKVYCNCFPAEKMIGTNPITNQPYADEVIKVGGLLLVSKRTDKVPQGAAIVGELTTKELERLKELCPEVFEQHFNIIEEKGTKETQTP